MPPEAPPPRLRFGQVWITRPSVVGPEPHVLPRHIVPCLVSLVDIELADLAPGHPAVAAVPVSLAVAFQSDRDLLVPAEAGPLGCAYMIEVWNEVTMLTCQLGRYVGELRQPFKRYLGRLYQAQLGTHVDLSRLASYLGPPLTGEHDPRFAFQIHEYEVCEYLRRPLLRLLRRLELR